MRLAEQTSMANEVRGLFPGSKIDDRRERPSHGYRAVHLVVEEQGRRVEIQIRTELQHLWAFTFELMSNLWGRQVRYGGPPDDPNRTMFESLRRGEARQRAEQFAAELARKGFPVLTRAVIVELLGTTAAQIKSVEGAQDFLASHDVDGSMANELAEDAEETKKLRDLVPEQVAAIRYELNVYSAFFHQARGE
jgi:Region found in RelA / SpoT proteins